MMREMIVNGLRREAEGGGGVGGFPLEALPRRVQGLLLDLVAYEHFRIEYAAAALLSAAATAIGNSFHLRIRGLWVTAPSLYLILVGRPGMGKTHPIEAAYRPIRRLDRELYERYRREVETPPAEDAGGGEGAPAADRPRLVRTIVTDFTVEALKKAHNDNQHGIVILVDEIMGMFQTANRYTASTLIEDLLSAFSGVPLNVARVKNAMPVCVERPCINIIGTTQTRRVKELFAKGYIDNGLIDRFLFVLPESSKIARVSTVSAEFQAKSAEAMEEWGAIVGRLLSLAPTVGGEVEPTVIGFSPDADAYFTEWWNGIVDSVNAIDDEERVRSREMKRDVITARIALVLQLLRWACGESHNQFVDLDSVRAAITLNTYFERGYGQLEAFVALDQLAPGDRAFYEALPQRFSTAEARSAAQACAVSERSVFNIIARLVQLNLLRKTAHGQYEKERL